MKHLITLASALALTSSFAGIAAAQSNDQLIAQAVSAAPESLRAGATVVNYDAKGMPVVLRQGTNNITCTPNKPGGTVFTVNCYPNILRAQNDMKAKETAEGKDAKTVGDDVTAALAAGKLPKPPMGTTLYSRSGRTEAMARGMWVVLVPGMTQDQSGLPTQPTAAGTAWLMRAGTPGAHIHIPQPVAVADTK